MVAGCGRLDFDARVLDVAGGTWNAYTDAGGAPCDLDARPYSACATGRPTGAAPCGGAMTDDLGAFDWTCDGDVYTGVLAPGKGLRDLVAAGGWRPDGIALDGVIGEPGVWWTNPVLPFGDNLDTPDAIYVATEDHA